MNTPLDRRRFLALGGGTAAAALTASHWASASTDTPVHSGPVPDGVFRLGVASGDPLPDRVVLWTRLAPQPLALDGLGGMPDRRVPVQWQVSRDESFTQVVRAGATMADPADAHSVHVDVAGLEPARWYYYRFRSGSELSPVGRTRTAPAPGAAVNRLNFAFASCQNYPAGYYTAHANLAREDLDVAFHLGDYIYEGGGQSKLGRGHVPNHEIRSLADYRVRHAQYRTDDNLQAVHAAFPWVVTWDDHEVENNWAGDDSDPDSPVEEFLARRASAFKAYWEHMPIRANRAPHGPHMTLYRGFTFGALATFNVLDTRQYRSDQVACKQADCADAFDPARTMLGDEQEAWLFARLRESRTRWNVLAQQVPLFEDPNVGQPSDKWEGYRASRARLLDVFAEERVGNPVVLTGDVHKNFAADLKLDWDDPAAPAVGSEFVGTSISSGGDGTSVTRYDPDPANPHIKFENSGDRGYVRLSMSDVELRADYRVVDTVERPESGVRTLASFRVEAGTPGIRRG
ncbi:alkaline phosphatase D family protein [Saccharomonospora xinjiangensis]|uniref:alkaline phosphatase D family protein n=1 Tax=Saccharomonospora xinjiangensis TaxID=75294 RepID=UPI00106FF467|nr:alkaline phosphatase D family protein [Saccharomonospora xinjiangensis]QBQ59952.1 Alkaline phosphatase D precursor [Saccharomonospora xinjiangensis]